MGPFDHWPTGGGGFEYFYGFIGGETNQWLPGALRAARRRSSRDRTPEEGYHFTEDMADKAIDWMRQQKALMPDKPFFVYFAPGATHAPHHVPHGVDRRSTRAGSTQGWDALREETFARQKAARRDPAGRRADRAPRGDPGVGRHARRRSSRSCARQMEVYAGFLEHTDHHVGRARSTRSTSSESSTTRSSTTSSATTAPRPKARSNGTLQRDDRLQRRRGARDARVHDRAHRRVRHARGLQPLRGRLGARDGHALPVDQAGRLALGRHAQRHDRALAERHRRPRARCATSSTTSSTSRRPSSRRPGCPSRRSSTASSRCRMHGVEHALLFDDASADERHETAVLRDVRATAASTTRAGPRSPGTAPVGVRREPPPARRRRLGALRHHQDWTQAHDLAAEQPGEARRAAAAVPDRGDASTTCCRSTTAASSASTPTWPAGPTLVKGNTQLLFGGMGRLQRELRHQHQEQVARRHREDRRCPTAAPTA